MSSVWWGTKTVGHPRKSVPQYCTVSAAARPRNIATPPMRGVGFVLTRRALG